MPVPTESNALDHFPGMPLLTYRVVRRLRLHRMSLGLCVSPDAFPAGRTSTDVGRYQVSVGGEPIGRYTVRRSGAVVERNFMCVLPVNTALPPGAVEQGTFGIAGAPLPDLLRILTETIQVAFLRIGLLDPWSPTR